MRHRVEAPRTGGFTMVELAVAIAVMVVGVMALAGVLISVSHQREQAAARQQTQGQAQALLEEILGTAPELVTSSYDKMTYKVDGVAGTLPDGRALTVSVDPSEPRLLMVTITGAWNAAGQAESLSLQSRIYNPKG